MPRLSAEDRRVELIDATVRVAVAEGLDAATVRRIAQEAGVPLGTVHYCFGSKAALISAVADSIEQPTIDVALLESLPTDQALVTAFRSYWEQIGSDRRRQLLIYELLTHLSRGDDASREIARRLIDRAYGAVLGAIRAYAQDLGRTLPVDPTVLARLVIAVTDGVSLAWIVNNDDDQAQVVMETFARLLAVVIDSGAEQA
ncbi:putative transcriptional regulator, TetR family protein [Flexivirga endophytica]|uniref:Transcriptional regulator, TetR family protein n=1 Tax=Flexivirga endophytica TaxID=1849103 RepID=A0A916WRT5_9MICO|nr:TetR/AcrR family transcriptional regulator [Flexivirga endophytica]GGB28529.1 putative transcriptional regulator, TetR family protein [Flexivirga endophytica]GHB62233.1 putative transcriptional regulator, TetR family protein [Flexivirga endophytica]